MTTEIHVFSVISIINKAPILKTNTMLSFIAWQYPLSNYYHLPMKLWEGKVFNHVCLLFCIMLWISLYRDHMFKLVQLRPPLRIVQLGPHCTRTFPLAHPWCLLTGTPHPTPALPSLVVTSGSQDWRPVWPCSPEPPIWWLLKYLRTVSKQYWTWTTGLMNIFNLCVCVCVCVCVWISFMFWNCSSIQIYQTFYWLLSAVTDFVTITPLKFPWYTRSLCRVCSVWQSDTHQYLFCDDKGFCQKVTIRFKLFSLNIVSPSPSVKLINSFKK